MERVCSVSFLHLPFLFFRLMEFFFSREDEEDEELTQEEKKEGLKSDYK